MRHTWGILLCDINLVLRQSPVDFGRLVDSYIACPKRPYFDRVFGLDVLYSSLLISSILWFYLIFQAYFGRMLIGVNWKQPPSLLAWKYRVKNQDFFKWQICPSTPAHTKISKQWENRDGTWHLAQSHLATKPWLGQWAFLFEYSALLGLIHACTSVK